jgi:uncharacterized protein YaiL (DUF2058 family)
MGLSLRDQLLQAGLISAKQAQQADKERHQHHKVQQQKPKPQRQQPQVDAAKLAAQRAQAEKIARDQELNRLAQEKAELKARKLQAKQLIEQQRLPRVDGYDYFNFIDGRKVRRIAVNPDIRAGLSEGRLAIARCEGRYDVVPSAAAAAIRERDERAIVPMHSETHAPVPAADDPYKDYVVPDDLIW